MEMDSFIMMEGNLMSLFPSPHLFIKVMCSQNYPPLLRSPSCHLTNLSYCQYFLA